MTGGDNVRRSIRSKIAKRITAGLFGACLAAAGLAGAFESSAKAEVSPGAEQRANEHAAEIQRQQGGGPVGRPPAQVQPPIARQPQQRQPSVGRLDYDAGGYRGGDYSRRGYDRGYDEGPRYRRRPPVVVYDEEPSYGGAFGRACATSRGVCYVRRPQPYGSGCRCDIPGFGLKRGNIEG